jgi:peptide/nickel transport system ATP-binding protein
MAILEIRDLKTYYQTRIGEKVRAVDGVSFELHSGEILGIAGESACGKSTLAISISGLFPPPLRCESGSVRLEDHDLVRMDQKALRKSILGKKLSYIPQSSMNALNPTLKIKNFVIDILKEHNPELTREEALELSRKRFESLSLSPQILEMYPIELSGGMKQRVVVVISTLMDPEVLIADEPTSALDVSSQKVVIKLIKELFEKRVVKSVIFITHELPILKHIAQKIAIMYAGELVEVGTTEQIIFDPIHPYSKALINSIIVPTKEIKNKKLPSLSGAPPDLRKSLSHCRFAERCPYATNACREKQIEMKSIDGRLVRCCRVDHWREKEKKEQEQEQEKEEKKEQEKEQEKEEKGGCQ